MKEVYAARIIDMTQAMARLKRVAEELGLPLAERKKTFNSRRAQELAKWAEAEGKGEAFHKAAFHAYFAEGKNIAKTGVLKGLAGAAGLSEKEAGKVLRQRPFYDAVDADWEMAYQLGISSVPTFVIDDEAIVGAQPYEVLEQFLLDKGVTRT